MKIDSKLYAPEDRANIRQKVFISMPMRDLRCDKIRSEFKRVEQIIEDLGYKNIEIFDNFFENGPVDANPLWFLSRSLSMLSNADIVYFVEGYDKARGCMFEWSAFKEYLVENGVRGYAEIRIDGELELFDANFTIPNGGDE